MEALVALGLGMAFLFCSWIVVLFHLNRRFESKIGKRMHNLRPEDEWSAHHNLAAYPESASMRKNQRDWQLDAIALALWMAFFAALMVLLPR